MEIGIQNGPEAGGERLRTVDDNGAGPIGPADPVTHRANGDTDALAGDGAQQQPIAVLMSLTGHQGMDQLLAGDAIPQGGIFDQRDRD